MTTIAAPFPRKALTPSRPEPPSTLACAPTSPTAPMRSGTDAYGQSEAHAARRRELLIRTLRR